MKKMKYGIAMTCLTVGMMLAIPACDVQLSDR